MEIKHSAGNLDTFNENLDLMKIFKKILMKFTHIFLMRIDHQLNIFDENKIIHNSVVNLDTSDAILNF